MIKANKIVGRDNLVDDFFDKIDSLKAIEYYGYAGIGKTTLKELISNKLENDYKDKYILIDYNFDVRQPDCVADVLFYLSDIIRQQFDNDNRYSNPFRFFTAAQVVYIIKRNYKVSYDKNDKDKSIATSRFLRSLTGFTDGDFTKSIKELLSKFDKTKEAYNIFEVTVNAISNVLFKDKKLEDYRNDLMKRNDSYTKEDDFLVFELIEKFNQELDKYCKEKELKIVIYLDAFDYLNDKLGEERAKNLKTIKEYLLTKEWLNTTENIIWVINDRDQNTKKRLQLDNIEIKGLEKEYVVELLNDHGITDSQLIDVIYNNSFGSPLLIEILINIYNKIIEDGNIPTINDFELDLDSNDKLDEKVIKSIVNRYTSRMNEKQRLLLGVMSVLGKWEENELFELLKETNYVQIDQGSELYKDIKNSSMIKNDNGVYSIKRSISDLILVGSLELDNNEELQSAFVDLFNARMHKIIEKREYIKLYDLIVNRYLNPILFNILIDNIDIVRHYYKDYNNYALLTIDETMLIKANKYNSEAHQSKMKETYDDYGEYVSDKYIFTEKDIVISHANRIKLVNNYLESLSLTYNNEDSLDQKDAVLRKSFEVLESFKYEDSPMIMMLGQKDTLGHVRARNKFFELKQKIIFDKSVIIESFGRKGEYEKAVINANEFINYLLDNKETLLAQRGEEYYKYLVGTYNALNEYCLKSGKTEEAYDAKNCEDAYRAEWSIYTSKQNNTL